MVGIELRRSLTDSSALAWIIGSCEEPHADVGAAALGVGGLDRAAEGSWAFEAVLSSWGWEFDVAVGSGDDDVEVVAPLAGVGGCGVANWESIQRALEVDRARRVGAANSWFYRGVSLHVHVERGAC